MQDTLIVSHDLEEIRMWNTQTRTSTLITDLKGHNPQENMYCMHCNPSLKISFNGNGTSVTAHAPDGHCVMYQAH
jgi:WD40 repeat protein